MTLQPTPSTGPSILRLRSVDKLTMIAQEAVQELTCDQVTVYESEMGYVIHAWDLFGGDAQRIMAEPRLVMKLVIVGLCEGLRWQDEFSHAVLDFGDVVLHAHARQGENLRVDRGALEAPDARSLEVSVRGLELSITDLERLLDQYHGEGSDDDSVSTLRNARDRLRARLSQLQRDLDRQAGRESGQ